MKKLTPLAHRKMLVKAEGDLLRAQAFEEAHAFVVRWRLATRTLTIAHAIVTGPLQLLFSRRSKKVESRPQKPCR